MTDDERAEILSDHLEARAGRPTSGIAPALTESDRAEIDSLVEVADLLWESAHGAPPIDQDPVAKMLGLVPDPERALDGRALARRRKYARVTRNELAARLRVRGWEVQFSDVYWWEKRSAAEVVPALVGAIAEEVGASTDRLTVVS